MIQRHDPTSALLAGQPVFHTGWPAPMAIPAPVRIDGLTISCRSGPRCAGSESVQAAVARLASVADRSDVDAPPAPRRGRMGWLGRRPAGAEGVDEWTGSVADRPELRNLLISRLWAGRPGRLPARPASAAPPADDGRRKSPAAARSGDSARAMSRCPCAKVGSRRPGRG